MLERMQRTPLGSRFPVRIPLAAPLRAPLTAPLTALTTAAVTIATVAALVLTAPPTPASAATTTATAPPARQAQVSRVIGHSVRGRAIHAYYLGTPGATHVLLLLGQMHGDEHAGPRTAAWVRAHVTPRPGTGLWVVPTMNPDGNARNTRRNARGVDLNRNWPTSGWRHTRRGSLTYGGPRPASEPETRAMIRFLDQVRPDYIASIHQPLHGIGRGSGHLPWLRRLHRELGLPLKWFGVGNPRGTVSPTMTGWYNRHHGSDGVATTIEYAAHPGRAFITVRAGRGIARAARVLAD
jgi:hypothetical protein